MDAQNGWRGWPAPPVHGNTQQSETKVNDVPVTVKVNQDIEDLVPIFLSNRARDLQTMLKARDEGDFAPIEQLGHRIAGTAGGYGFDGLSAIGKALEKASRAGHAGDVSDQLARMAHYLETVQIEIV